MSDDPKRFRFLRLEVWREGRKLCGIVSRMVGKFPREEAFGLTSQMRRSVRSVCANIAEGRGRNDEKDFAQFVEMASGSAPEVASDGFPALDGGYITQADLEQLLVQVEGVVSKASGLHRKLAATGISGAPRSALRAPRSALRALRKARP
ncbi:MAG: four helix bundle protein [Verrucomicrobiota bacterium]